MKIFSRKWIFLLISLLANASLVSARETGNNDKDNRRLRSNKAGSGIIQKTDEWKAAPDDDPRRELADSGIIKKNDDGKAAPDDVAASSEKADAGIVKKATGNDDWKAAKAAPDGMAAVHPRRELLFFEDFFNAVLCTLSFVTFGLIPCPSDDAAAPPATPTPTATPSIAPTMVAPSSSPSREPTREPTAMPSIAPTTVAPSGSPTSEPTRSPVVASADCDPNLSELVFFGHNEAFSLETGFINITWSPPFVGRTDDLGLIWCGDYTFHIFTSEGEDEDVFFARVANKTIPELIDMANADPNDDFFLDETNDLFFEWDFFIPSVDYTILVTASTRFGHFSENREPARLQVATTVPKLREDFSEVIVVPQSEEFVTEVLDDGAVVLFFGDLPPEVLEIKAGSFFYADGITNNDNPALLACETTVDTQTLSRPAGSPAITGSSVACSVREAEIDEIFDDLDASGDLFDSVTDLDDDELEPLSSEEEEEVLNDLVDVPEVVLEDLCVASFPGSEDPLADCLLDAPTEGTGRQLFGRRFRRRARKFFRRVKRALDRKITLTKTVTFIDIERAGKMVCESESGNRATEIGLGFDFSAHSRFKLQVKILSGFQFASVELFGGFGVRAYALMTATLEKRLQPKPKKLFEQNNRRFFAIGVVPVIVNIRPSLSAFVEAALVVEADMLVAAQYGYDYNFRFEKRRSSGFTRTSSFVQRPIFEREPVFDLRINAAAEMGLTFAIDVVFFGVLQGTLAADIGLGAEIEVGSNVEALVVTSPIFYTLDKFELDAFVRIRGFVGLNSALSGVVRKVEDLAGGDDKFECVISSGRYEIPELPEREPETPTVFTDALSSIEPDSTLLNKTAIALDELLGPLVDDFSPERGALEGQSLDFGVNFKIFEENFFLLGIPNIETVARSSETCQGENAIVLDIGTELETSLIKFLDGLKDGEWFGNFDGTVLSEDTNWVLGANKDTDSLTVTLPRSAIATQPFFQIQEAASVILRATPEIFPFPPKSMFAKADLNELFEIEPFECCDVADCIAKLGDPGVNQTITCESNACVVTE